MSNGHGASIMSLDDTGLDEELAAVRGLLAGALNTEYERDCISDRYCSPVEARAVLREREEQPLVASDQTRPAWAPDHTVPPL